MNYNPLDLEVLLIPSDQWNNAPKEAQKIAKEQTKEGIPTGISYDPSTGSYFVLQSSGQGPYVIWQSSKNGLEAGN